MTPSLKTRLIRIEEDLDLLSMSLLGNGQLGLKTRLDRLEQEAVRRCYWLRVIGVAAAGLVLKALWDILSHTPLPTWIPPGLY